MRPTLLLALSLIATGAASCSSTTQPAAEEGTLISTNDRIVLRKRPLGTVEVRNLLVKQIEVRFDQDWPSAKNAESLKNLREAFAEAVRLDLGDAYPLVREAGPGVVVVETMLTDRVRDPELLARLPSKAAGTSKRAFLELELIDSLTNEKLVVAVYAPEPMMWERLLEPRIPLEHKVGALREFTGALRRGLDANRDILGR